VSKNTLPRCELPGNSRYDKEILTFHGCSKLKIYSRDFISNSGGIATICGSRISNEKVWIKVCNANLQENGKKIFTLRINAETI